MKRLVLVRHGETIWHADDRYAGETDIPLTRTGLRQADQLAQWADQAGLSGLWCSPLQRALKTAEPVACRCALPVHIEPDLAELSFGLAEGLTRAEVMYRFAEEYAAFVLDPVLHPLPSGEDPAAAAERGLMVLQRILHGADDGTRILVVAHSTLLRLSLCRLFGISISRYRTVFPQLGNVSLTEVAFKPAGPALLHFNVPLPASQPGGSCS